METYFGNFFSQFPEIFYQVLSPEKIEDSIRKQLKYVRMCNDEEDLESIASCQKLNHDVRLEAAKRIKSQLWLSTLLDIVTLECSATACEIAFLAADKIEDKSWVNHCMKSILHTFYHSSGIYSKQLQEAIARITDISVLDSFLNFLENTRSNHCNNLIDMIYERSFEISND